MRAHTTHRKLAGLFVCVLYIAKPCGDRVCCDYKYTHAGRWHALCRPQAHMIIIYGESASGGNDVSDQTECRVSTLEQTRHARFVNISLGIVQRLTAFELWPNVTLTRRRARSGFPWHVTSRVGEVIIMHWKGYLFLNHPWLKNMYFICSKPSIHEIKNRSDTLLQSRHELILFSKVIRMTVRNIFEHTYRPRLKKQADNKPFYIWKSMKIIWKSHQMYFNYFPNCGNAWHTIACVDVGVNNLVRAFASFAYMHSLTHSNGWDTRNKYALFATHQIAPSAWIKLAVMCRR